MSKFVDKIAGALGFSSEYDEYEDYEDEDYVEEEVPKKTVSYETNRTRYEEDRKEYDNTALTGRRIQSGQSTRQCPDGSCGDQPGDLR